MLLITVLLYHDERKRRKKRERKRRKKRERKRRKKRERKNL